MLRGMQNATRNWLGRIITGILLGLIAISFAVWGIGDVFRGFGQSTLAKIGSTEISIEQFRTSYNDRLQQLIRQLGRPLPADQARALGLHRQLLGQMLAEGALDEEVNRLRLNIPDSVIAESIRNDPTFRGITGQFDRARFDAVIRQAGFTEQRYVNEQRKVLLRQQVIRSVTGGLAAPAVAVDIQNRYANEQRAIDYFELGPAQAGEIAEPSAEELTKFFDERKALFRAPAFRKVEMIVLTQDAIAAATKISEDEVKKAYEANRAKYVTPERREVHQIVFQNDADVQAALQKLSEPGMTFEQFSASPERKGSDVNLGLVSRAQVLDPAVADAAFSLPSGQVSEPIKGRFGTVLLKVGKVEQEQTRELSEVASELSRNLSMERARSAIRTLYDNIEDERGGGATLAEIAKKLDLKVTSVEAVDRSGRDPAGNTIPNIPAVPALFAGIFEAEIGLENEPVQVPGGNGYVWYEVLSSTPPRERTLDEVRDRVIERWRNDQVAARLKERASEALERLKSASIADVAAEFGAKPQFVAGLRRDRAQGDIPAEILDSVFDTPKDGVGSSEAGATRWFLFRVTGVTVPASDQASEETKRLQAALVNAYSEDMVAQFISRLQTDLGATINESALNQVIGGVN